MGVPAETAVDFVEYGGGLPALALPEQTVALVEQGLGRPCAHRRIGGVAI